MSRSVEDTLVVRMESTLRQFERQMEAGRKAAVTAATQSEHAWMRSGRMISANANTAATGLGRLTNISGRGRFVIQNTANQIGDMAVQLEGGTNAMRVMSQQLPQVLGGFGALGGSLGIVAPLLGTVAAVGIPLAAMFYSVGSGADDAEKKVKTFSDKLKDAEAAVSAANSAMIRASEDGLDTLADRYVVVTDRVRELADALYEIEKRGAIAKVGTVLDDALGSAYEAQLDRVFGTVGAAIAQAGTEEASENIEIMRQQIADLKAEIALFEATGQQVPAYLVEQLAVMQEEIAALEGRMSDIGGLAAEMIVPEETLIRLQELRDTLEEARAAGDFNGVADALNDIRNILIETGVEIEQGVLDNLVAAEDLARQMAAAFADGKIAAENLAAAASGIASAITPAVNEAVRLVGALRSGVALLQMISGMKTVAGGVMNGAEGYWNQLMGAAQNPVAPNSSIRPQLPSVNASFGAPATSGGGRGRGSGGGSARKSEDFFASAEREIQAIERKIEMLGKETDEIAALEAKYKLLDEAKKRGLDLDAKQANTGETLAQQIDRQAQSIGELTREYEQAKERADFFNEAQEDLKDGFLDAIVEGENLAGVLEDLAKALAKAAFQAALFGEGPFSSGGGGLGSFVTSLFSAKGNAFSAGGQVVPFARGGVVNGPTMFNMRGAKTGVMGEAGPEAIMPLVRGPNGKLGVSNVGGGSVSLTFAPVIDARGADPAQIEALREEMRTQVAGFEMRVHSTLRTGRNTRRNLTWRG